MPVRCPLCGELNAACGPRTGTVGITVTRKEPTVGELKNYDVEINGKMTTLRLNEEDAKAQGLLEATKPKTEPAKKAAAPSRNKARTAANKSKS